MSTASQGAEILSPQFQDEYWDSMSPNINHFLSEYEECETWTYRYEEVPELFKQVSEIVPVMASSNINDIGDADAVKLLEGMIVILATMPFRQAVTCIIWLDKGLKSSLDIGWAITLYIEALAIVNNRKDSPIYAEASLLQARISVMLKSRLAVRIFTQLNLLNENIR